MKMLIELSEEIKDIIDRNGTNEIVIEALWQAVKKGTPIKDGGICDICKQQELGTLAICFHVRQN